MSWACQYKTLNRQTKEMCMGSRYNYTRNKGPQDSEGGREGGREGRARWLAVRSCLPSLGSWAQLGSLAGLRSARVSAPSSLFSRLSLPTAPHRVLMITQWSFLRLSMLHWTSLVSTVSNQVWRPRRVLDGFPTLVSRPWSTTMTFLLTRNLHSFKTQHPSCTTCHVTDPKLNAQETEAP